MTALVTVGGWVLSALLVGLWWGERKMRIFVQNQTTFGGTPTPATSWPDVSPEDRIEEEITKIEEIAGERMKRSGGTDVKYDQQTLENGVEFLLSEARERGEQLSVEMATDEAERMLNAEGSEM